MRHFAQAVCLSTTMLLAGCAGGPALPGPETAAATGPEFVMPGRWILTAPDAPSCGMNFTATAGQNEGAVVPEGGCPGRFFTGRRWALDKQSLTIIDDRKETLATLTFANGRFEGKSVNDIPVTLNR